jgi:hypothetical protein
MSIGVFRKIPINKKTKKGGGIAELVACPHTDPEVRVSNLGEGVNYLN